MRVEVLGGLERRRRWSQDDKARIVEETLAPGAKVPAESGHDHIRRRGGTPAFLDGRPWVRYARWSQERTFVSGRGKASKRPSAAFERRFTAVFE